MPDWPHEPCDPDAMSGVHGGDVCPWCGEALKYTDVVRHAGTLEIGEVMDLSPDDVSEPLLHPECVRAVSKTQPSLLRQESDQRPLSDYTGG